MSPAAQRARARRAGPTGRKRWPKVKPNPGLDRLTLDRALADKIAVLIDEASWNLTHTTDDDGVITAVSAIDSDELAVEIVELLREMER